MKEYPIFLFDADGTLFDFNKSERIALEATLNEFDLKFNEEVLKEYHDINSVLWGELQKGNTTLLSLEVERFSLMGQAVGYDLNPIKVNASFLAQLEKGNHLMDGAIQLCQRLKHSGKELFIVTNGGTQTQTSRIGSSGIKDFFSKIFNSEKIGTPKPNAEFFDYVFNDIGKPKEDMIIVGDSLSADILGGNNAGIDTCWYNHQGINKNTTDILPTYQINSLDQL